MDWASFSLLLIGTGIIFLIVDSDHRHHPNRLRHYVGATLIAVGAGFTAWQTFGSISSNEIGISSLYWNHRERRILPPSSSYVVPPWTRVERFALVQKLESRENSRGNPKPTISKDGRMAIVRVEVAVQFVKPQYAGLVFIHFRKEYILKERLEEVAGFAATRTVERFTLDELKGRSAAVISYFHQAMREEVVLLFNQSDELRRLPSDALLSLFELKDLAIRDVLAID